MKKVLFTLLVLAVGQLGLNAQKTVQGTVAYKYTISGEGSEMMAGMMPEKMVVVYGDNAMMTYMEGGMMAGMMGKVIVNNGKGFVIKEDTETVYNMSEEDMKSAEAQQEAQTGKATKVDGKTKEILGYQCQLYQVEVSQNGQKSMQNIWVTEELKAPEMKGAGATAMNQGMMGAIDIDGFPMEVVVNIPQTSMEMVLSVTDLNMEKPDPAMFAKPDGFTEKPFAEMMKAGGF